MTDTTLTRTVVDLWNRFASDINESFGFPQPFKPHEVIIYNPQSTFENMGGFLEEQVVHLSEHVMKGDLPIEAVTAALCFQAAFPHGLVCCECIEDLSIEYGRQQLEDNTQENWVEQWKTYQEQRDGDLHKRHFSYWYLPRLSKLLGVDALSTLSREIAMMANAGIPFDLDDYHAFLNVRRTKFTAPLSKTELKLVDQILHHGAADLSKLGRGVGVSPQWISRKMSELRNKGILRHYNQIPFSKFSIRMFLLFIDTKESSMNAFEYVKNCPFLFGRQRIIAGNYQLMAIISIPDNEYSIESMNQGIKLMSRNDISTHISEIYSSGKSYCFDHYDPERGQWNIPWDLLRIELETIKNKGLAKIFPRIDTTAKRTDLRIDEIDIEILKCVEMGIASVNNIREKLKIGQHKVASRLKEMRKTGLITSTWEIRNIGLNESVVVTTSDKKSSEAIASWAQRLPKSIISFNQEGHLLLQTHLPSGGGHGLSSAVKDVCKNATVSFTEQIIQGTNAYPFDLWDVEKQGWNSPKLQIHKWLDDLK
ncbi:MAG: hypothetical protein ACTSUO_09270 [Candidatus Thorarchaeota archaeon]